MATFQIEANGAVYEIEAPDEKTAMEAFSKQEGAAPDLMDQWERAVLLPMEPQTYDDSMFAQVMSGVNQGIANTLGMPVDLVTAGLNLGSSGINAAFGTQLPQITNPIGGSQTFTDLFGASIKPETDDQGTQFARRMAEEFGMAAFPMAGTAAKAARPLQLLAKEAGLVAGSGAGAATAEAIAPDNPLAEFAGQTLGGLGVAGLSRTARKMITPLPGTEATRLKAVETMKREGVDLTAGQQTGSKRLQYMESSIGGAKMADITERQAEQFTRAALKRAGISSNRATPEVMDEAFTRIGNEFDALASRNTVLADRQMAGDLRTVWQDYTSLVPKSDRKPVVENLLVDIAETIRKNNGQISGESYKALRSRIERFARGTSDPELADALRGIKGALDNAMERWIAQNNPADMGAWQQARRDYRNMLVLERAAQGGGEDAALGIISPARLRMAVQSIYGKRSYVRGKDEFSEMAQAGQATMTPLPQSGTEPRLSAKAKNLLNPLNWIDGAVASAILSEPGKRYLANQRLGKAVPNLPSRLVPLTTMTAGQTSNPLPLEIIVRGGQVVPYP